VLIAFDSDNKIILILSYLTITNIVRLISPTGKTQLDIFHYNLRLVVTFDSGSLVAVTFSLISKKWRWKLKTWSRFTYI